VVIRDRKDLTGFESAIDFSTVVTRILPVGYDGLLLPELYVDSPKLGDYVVPRIRVIRYGQVKAITDKDNPREGELPLDQAHGELRRLAAAEFSAKHVDEPSASYKIRFTDL
ncbi:phage tail spike protein, partial [Aerococcus urinae]|nr:phage tail spike protein [Aerococcus urinae]